LGVGKSGGTDTAFECLLPLTLERRLLYSPMGLF